MGKREKAFVLIVRILLISLFFVLWEWVARAKLYNPFFTSYPSEIIKDLVKFYIS